jgi:methionyl-tRNA formyltransferase
MRMIMMGTGPFAVPTFRRLLDSRHEIPLLVTRPARPMHGKTQAEVNPMRELALERGLPIFEPESINTAEAQAELSKHQVDLFVVCDYGQILKPDTLAIARLGGINLHASLLPKYRGAAPINWAIYHGDLETGVTVIHMTLKVDAGPAIEQARMSIGPHDTAANLEPRLADLGAPLVLKAIDDLEQGRAKPIEQNQQQASRAPRLKKSDGLIDWARSAQAIKNQIRAMQPWPKSYTYWHRPGGEPLRLIVESVEILPAICGQPGDILEATGETLIVATGDGRLQIKELQPAGKRVMTAGDFLRGQPVRQGQKFGPETA